jgi:hypothetical protein
VFELLAHGDVHVEPLGKSLHIFVPLEPCREIKQFHRNSLGQVYTCLRLFLDSLVVASDDASGDLYCLLVCVKLVKVSVVKLCLLLDVSRDVVQRVDLETLLRNKVIHVHKHVGSLCGVSLTAEGLLHHSLLGL